MASCSGEYRPGQANGGVSAGSLLPLHQRTPVPAGTRFGGAHGGSRSGTGAAGSRPAHDQKGSAMELVVDLLTFFALTAGGMLPLTKAARIC